MGIVITWSQVFWAIAAVIAVCGLGYFLLRVTYAIAVDENAPDVSIDPKTSAPDVRATEFREATDEAFPKKVPEFGRRHSLPPNPRPPRSFFHNYRPADVAESWKHHGTAALNKMALLHTGHGLQHRFRKGLKASRKIASRSGRFIFVKSGGFFRRLGRGQTSLNRRVKAKEGLAFLAEPLIGQFRKVRQLFLRRLGWG